MDVKLGLICPHRNDRPLFLEHVKGNISRQTLQPTEILFIDYQPKSENVDITERYRIGYDALKNKNLDLISFIEVDDLYAPNYMEYMVNAWENAGKPDLFGTNYTHYFNIKLRKHFTMEHYTRSSMMNTFIKPDLNFPWCPDTTAYTDMHLWDNLKQLTRALIKPEPPISIGIKHGVGLCGGQGHNNGMDLYTGPRGVDDPNFDLLRGVADNESFKFFSGYFTSP